MSVDSYHFEMRQQTAENWKYAGTANHRYLSLTISNLSPKTTYDLRAYAVNKDNLRCEEQYSNYVTISTESSKPSKPDHSKVSLDVLDHSTAQLVVAKPRLADSGSELKTLKVIRFNEKKHHVGEQLLVISKQELNDQSDYLHKEIKIDSSTHFVQIVLKNDVGSSDPSDFVGVAPTNLIPGVPRNFIDVKAEAQARQITLKWEPPHEHERAAKQYILEMKTKPTQQGRDIDLRWTPVDYERETKDNEHFATVKSLHPCSEYCFRLHAVNDRIKGQYTDEISVSTTGSRPDNPSMTHVSLSYTDPSKAVATLQKLDHEKENGSRVTEITIQLSKNLRQWENCGQSSEIIDSNEIDLHKVEVTLPNIEYVDPNLDHFFFHAKMRNKFGQSGPSEVVSVPFSVLRPGKVQKVRAKCLKVHFIE